MEVIGQIYALVVLSPWNGSWYQLNLGKFGPQSYSGCFKNEKNLILPGVETRIAQPVAQSLHGQLNRGYPSDSKRRKIF